MAGSGTAALGLIAPMTNILGTGLKSLFDDGGYTVDPTMTRATYGLGLGEYEAAGADSADRIGAINNPYIFGSLANADALRRQQDQYLSDLLAQASGARSEAWEQAMTQVPKAQAELQGAAASTRGAFGREGAQRAATYASSAMPMDIIAPTKALAAQEQARAQGALAQLYGQRFAQDQQSQKAVQDQDRLKRQQILSGQKSLMGFLQMGGGDKRRQTGNEVGWQEAYAKYHG